MTNFPTLDEEWAANWAYNEARRAEYEANEGFHEVDLNDYTAAEAEEMLAELEADFTAIEATELAEEAAVTFFGADAVVAAGAAAIELAPILVPIVIAGAIGYGIWTYFEGDGNTPKNSGGVIPSVPSSSQEIIQDDPNAGFVVNNQPTLPSAGHQFVNPHTSGIVGGSSDAFPGLPGFIDNTPSVPLVPYNPYVAPLPLDGKVVYNPELSFTPPNPYKTSLSSWFQPRINNNNNLKRSRTRRRR